MRVRRPIAHCLNLKICFAFSNDPYILTYQIFSFNLIHLQDVVTLHNTLTYLVFLTIGCRWIRTKPPLFYHFALKRHLTATFSAATPWTESVQKVHFLRHRNFAMPLEWDKTAMNDGIDVRIRLTPERHKKWLFAANLRGLTLTAYITATVSGEMIRTGELSVTPVTAAEPPLKAASPTPALTPKSATQRTWMDDEEDDLSQYDGK